MTTPNHTSRKDGRHRLRTLVGLFGAPLAWVLQMSLCEPLAANSCFRYQSRSLAGFWESLPMALKLLSILFIAAGLLSGLAARQMWRDAMGIEAGNGRQRFLAKLALMSSFVFFVAIVFTACAAFLVSPCKPS